MGNAKIRDLNDSRDYLDEKNYIFIYESILLDNRLNVFNGTY